MKKWLFLIGFLTFGACVQAQSWQAFADSATGFEKLNQPASALRYFKTAQENLPKDSLNTLAEIQLLRQIAEQHLRLSQY